MRGNVREFNRLIPFFLFMTGTVLFFVFFCWRDINKMFLAIVMIFASNVWYSVSNVSKRIAYTLFLGAFFCFLLGRMAVEFFTTGYVHLSFSEKITSHMMTEIALSLIFLQIGYSCFESASWKNKRRGQKEKRNALTHKKYLNRLRHYAEILFYISASLAIMANIEKMIYIHRFSYVDIFKNFSSQIPRPLQVLGNMHIASFMVFLSTCPPKRKCIVPIAVYCLIAGSALLFGDRGNFIIDGAAVLSYIFWRQYKDRETWISRPVFIAGIISIPFLIAFMSYFVYLREGVDIGQHTFGAQFVRFFRASGNSVDILGYGKVYQSRFPKKGYALGEIIDYIKYNPIVKRLFQIREPQQHTKEYAMTMHSYAHTISYFIFSDQYLLGHGKGSSYIGEAYHDFGYMGIALCNLIYGIFLAKINDLQKTKPIFTAAAFISLRILFYVPRGPMIAPVSYVLNITTLFVLFFLQEIAKIRIFQKSFRRNQG